VTRIYAIWVNGREIRLDPPVEVSDDGFLRPTEGQYREIVEAWEKPIESGAECPG